MTLNERYRKLAGLDAIAVMNAVAWLDETPALPDAIKDHFSVEEPALETTLLDHLVHLGFIQLDRTWTERVRNYLSLCEAREEAEALLPELERRLKTMDVKVKHASDKRSRNRLLKSKSTQWEEASHQDTLEKQREELLKYRAVARAAREQANDGYEALSFDLSRAEDAKSYRWVMGRAARLTAHGEFLHAVMVQIGPSNAYGRTLGDALSVGPLLA